MIDFTRQRLAFDTMLIQLSGRLDETSRSYFFECVSDMVDEGIKHIVVDCEALGLISSSGLASLLRARKKAERNGAKIYLTAVNSVVGKVLERTRLATLFAIYPTPGQLFAKMSSNGIDEV